jgi:hypothetical protein
VTLSDTDLEARLRDLRGLADDVPPAPLDLAELTRARYRVERRRRARLAAVGIAAALVVVGVPAVAGQLDPLTGRQEVAAPTERTFTPSPPSGLYALPPRGDLATDEEWLAGVAALPWEPLDASAYAPGIEMPDAPVETRRVAFAGDVPTGRVALVLGMSDRHLLHAWFVGPKGADPEEMELATGPSEAGSRDALGLIDARDPSASSLTLLVVAHPGDTVERSLTPVVERSGELRRENSTVDLVDGIGVVEVPAPWPWGAGGMLLQAHGQEGPRNVQLTDSERLRGDDAGAGLAPEVPIADPRGLADRTQQEVARHIAGVQLAGYGLSAEEARPTLLAAGPLGPRMGQYGELYGMTHPSGATSTWLLTYPPGRSESGTTIHELPPAAAGTALLDRVIALRAMAGLMVSAPAGVRAQLLDAAGVVLGEFPLVGGAGTGGPDGGAGATTVRILDGGGDVLAEAPVTGTGG